MDKSTVRGVTMATVIGVALGLGRLLLPHTSGVAWAEEPKKTETAQPKDVNDGYTARRRQTQTMPGMPRPMETTILIRESLKYGLRTDSREFGRITLSIYNDYVEGTSTFLFHTMRTYTRRTGLKGASLRRHSEDPRPDIKEALAGDHKKLGRRTIDGVEAEGIEVCDATGHRANFKIDSVVTQYWSDVETGRPVLVEQTVLGNGGAVRIKAVTDQFRWNVACDPNEFKGRIPPGYTEMELPKR